MVDMIFYGNILAEYKMFCVSIIASHYMHENHCITCIVFHNEWCLNYIKIWPKSIVDVGMNSWLAEKI